MKPAEIPIIGLTGGIASGKSTVARRLRDRGVAVVDADRLARQVVAPGQPLLRDLVEAFGADILDEEGALRRKALGKIVFADPAQLAILNALTHPAIKAAAADRVRAHQANGYRWAIYEAALILENDLSPGLAALIAVVCDPMVQRSRIVRRDGLTETEAERRIAAQTSNAVRRERADYLVENDSSVTALLDRTDALLTELEARFGPMCTAGAG